MSSEFSKNENELVIGARTWMKLKIYVESKKTGCYCGFITETGMLSVLTSFIPAMRTCLV
jgi:hypothetical protein